MSAPRISMGSVVTWPWLFQTRHFRRFRFTAAIPYVVRSTIDLHSDSYGSCCQLSVVMSFVISWAVTDESDCIMEFLVTITLHIREKVVPDEVCTVTAECRLFEETGDKRVLLDRVYVLLTQSPTPLNTASWPSCVCHCQTDTAASVKETRRRRRRGTAGRVFDVDILHHMVAHLGNVSVQTSSVTIRRVRSLYLRFTEALLALQQPTTNVSAVRTTVNRPVYLSDNFSSVVRIPTDCLASYPGRCSCIATGDHQPCAAGIARRGAAPRTPRPAYYYDRTCRVDNLFDNIGLQPRYLSR